MADWDEVKRLAADFQKIQLSSTVQRLSERNCIEIVTWLMQRKVIDLIFTTDGKEYITPSQLVQDIRGELYVNGGRVNLVELAKSIGVDLNHITAHINEVLKGHKDIHSVLGQLIDNNYIVRIAGEINEKLSQQGQINVNDLTLQYDLPADFIQQNVLEKNLGKLIFGKQDKSDPRVFFTESFIARSKAKIRGALAGLTRPTPIPVILNHIDISEKLFFSLFDQTCAFGMLTGRMTGAQYIPNVYSRSQNEWVHNFYKQNSYLEFDALSRLGISDYKTYLKKQFPNESFTFLNSCAISKSIIERAEADVDECIISKSHLNIQNNLPSVFNEKDIKILLDLILSGQKSKETIIIEQCIISKAFIENLSKSCEDLVEEKAKFIVESGKYQQYQTDLIVGSNKTQKIDVEEEIKVDKKEERRKKAAGGKSGGGTQGRETKTKSTKKATRIKVEDEYEIPEKKTVLEIVSLEEVKNIIEEKLQDEGLEDLMDSIAEYIMCSLNSEGLEKASKIYASTVTDRTANRRQTHNEIQNKLNILIGDVRLFEKGIKLFPSETQTQLSKYLLKTLCTDVTNEILNYISCEKGSNITVDNFTHEQRLKYANELTPDYKGPLLILIKTLSGQSIEDFMNAAEDALSACSMIIKKIDKKKDRVLILNHKHSLLEQLNKCDDPALVLHLAVLVIFITATQCMLHASGRHVAAILAFLKQYLTSDQAIELASYHDLVILMLNGGAEAENAKEKLMETMPSIKMLANEYKKPPGEKS